MSENKNLQQRESVDAAKKVHDEEAEIFKLLVSAVQDYAIFALDSNGHILTWNAGAERLKGYRADEIVGSHFSRFYTQEDVARNHPEEELKIATRKGVYEEEGWRLRKDGSRFWANVVITALKDSQGNLRGFAKVTRDLTEKKLADEKLRRSEEQLRLANESLEVKVAERTMQLTQINRLLAAERSELETIFQVSPAAMALWTGPNFVFEKVNPKYQAIFPDRVLAGKPFLEACPEFKDQPFLELLRKVFETGEPFVGNEVLARHPDFLGGPLVDHYYDFTYMRVNDADGKPYGIYDHAVDVTDKVRAREAMENQNRWLEEVLNRLPIGLVMAEPGTANYRFVNHAAQKMLGQAPKDARIDLRPEKLILRDLNEKVLSVDETPSARAAHGKELTNEVIILDKGKERIFVSCNSNIIPAMPGHKETVLVPFVDISELKLKELELESVVKDLEDSRKELLTAVRELEYERTKLISVFAQAPVGICVLEGPEHIFSILNPTYSSLFFGGRNDFIGRSFKEADPEAAKQGFDETLNRVYQTGEPFVGNEVPIDLIQKNGKSKRFHLNFVYQPLRDSDQKVYGIVAVVQDVSEQVQSRATLETIFQESPAAMVLWKGTDLIFDKINPGYQAIFSNRELLGKPFTEALPETKGQPFEQWIKHVFETGVTRVQSEQLAKLILCEGGSIEDRYFDMSFVRVMGVDNQPYGVYEHAVDVTDRVLSRRAIEQGKAELEMTVKSLEQERDMRERFVATLSHDLRTPLTAAKMSAQLILRKAVENQDLQRLAIKVADNMDRADEMIRDLLDANLIRAGEKLPIETVPSNLREIVAATIDDLSTVYGDRFTLSADQPIHGMWSPNGIRRILENLCSNAIKYGTFQRPINIVLNLKQDIVNIEVSNEGPPIPLLDQENLFEPFHRASSAKSGGQKGWGLGLTLVKGIAEAHGGTVSVASSEHQGTTFTVSLPVECKP